MHTTLRSLAIGRCLPDHTFGDLSTFSGSTEEFAIELVQLFDLTPPADESAQGAAEAWIEQASVLTARRADAMMLPFRTSMLLRVE